MQFYIKLIFKGEINYMFIHLYSFDTWGLIESKIEDKDIEITKEEYEEILKQQNKGIYYAVKNCEAENLNDLFIKIEPLQIEKKLSAIERIEMLENENADLLMDSAIKDFKIETLESDIADIMIEIASLGGIK